MQISKKSIYAIRAMIYISGKKDNRLSTITEIAENEKIPREYLAKVLKELANKGLLQSFKGVKGGYRPAKDRSRISFLDIIRAIQPSFSSGNGAGENNGLYRGASFGFWQDLFSLMRHKLGDMTLDKVDYDKFYGHN